MKEEMLERADVERIIQGSKDRRPRGFDSRAELVLDMRWARNHIADKDETGQGHKMKGTKK